MFGVGCWMLDVLPVAFMGGEPPSRWLLLCATVALTLLFTDAGLLPSSGAPPPAQTHLAASQPDPKPDLTVAPADRLRALMPTTIRSTRPDFVAYVPRVTDGQVADTGNEHFMVFDGPDKSLLTIWSQSTFEGQGDQHTVFARSLDQGKTWSPPKIIAGPARPGEGFSANWAVPLVSKSGRIYVLYCQSGPKWDVGRNVSTRLTGIYTDDAGKTWSQPQTIEMPRTSRDNPDPSYPPN